MKEKITGINCAKMGVSTTTDIFVEEKDGQFEARVGIALFGMIASPNQYEFDPFHPDFQDNYCSGKGSSKQFALDDLKNDIQKLSESLFV